MHIRLTNVNTTYINFVDRSGVTRGLGAGGGGPPRVTPSRGVTLEGKNFFVGKCTKNSGQTRSDR